MKVISAKEAFERFRHPENLVRIDVRSEGEFNDGHFDGVLNIPILNDGHRHQVGLTYKNKGQEAAIVAGHSLVDPLKPQLLEQWQQASRGEETIVYCWRGGLRSKISCEWMNENHVRTVRVEGGYKAIRQEVLPHFPRARKLTMLSGMTGTQKTEVLKAVPNNIDLEMLANHRGSAFGLLIKEEQPRQATFENNLAIQLANIDTNRALVLEDESRLIGHCIIPEKLYSQMAAAPLVVIEDTVESRAAYIYQSYVQLSLAKAERSAVRDHFQKSLLRIAKKLGGLQTDQTLKIMNEAFFHNSKELHQQWIASLLVHYYDKLYMYAFEKKGRPIAFKGSRDEVRAYLNA